MLRFETLVAAAYLGIAVLWIAVSDLAVARIFPEHITEAQMVKGWLFVGVTAALLFAAVRRYRLFRERIENDLRTSNARLALAQNAAGVGIWDCDIGTGEVTWSASFSRLLSLDHQAVTPSVALLRDCVHPDDRMAMESRRAGAYAAGGSFRDEFRIVGRDGDVRHLATLGQVLRDVEGRPIRCIGLALDVTDRAKAMEALTLAKQESERANVAKSEFLAAASHDLRQPVQGLMLYMGMVRQRASGMPMRVLDGMQEALDALKLTLDALLDVSRIDAGLVVPEMTRVPLGALLARLAAEYAQQAAGRGLNLRVVGSSAAVRTDPELLEWMVRNLIENALRFTVTGGVVVGCRLRAGTVRLEVVDSGIGIAQEHLEQIFDEFFQVSNPERDRRRGLGLGLAITRRLGRLLGHEVGVVSRPGRGSRFFIAMLDGAPEVGPSGLG